MEDSLIISKRPLKGEDSHKVFSVRLKNETVEKLDRLALTSHRSRNELISILLEYALDKSVVE